MAKLSRPRFGSLQFWPRKRAEKEIHSVNWKEIKAEGIQGFIGYKVGMTTAAVKDMTDKSMTGQKKIFLPVTILEVPPMKIYSVRFYKFGKVLKDIVVSNDKELKKKLKITKNLKPLEEQIPKEYDDVRVITYSLPKNIGLKKTPDLIEIGIGATDKVGFVKTLIGKEITLADFSKNKLLDARGLTKGKGLVGPVKRFGVTFKQHKSEKVVRRPGSLGPWHPARVIFRVPLAGQLGMFSRTHYNYFVLDSNNASQKTINPNGGFKHYGFVNGDYIILKGSVQGPPKRQILLTPAIRPTKKTSKKKYELIEVNK